MHVACSNPYMTNTEYRSIVGDLSKVNAVGTTCSNMSILADIDNSATLKRDYLNGQDSKYK